MVCCDLCEIVIHKNQEKCHIKLLMMSSSHTGVLHFVCGTVCLSAASLNNSMDEWVGGWMDDWLVRCVELHGRWLSEWLEFVSVCV